MHIIKEIIDGQIVLNASACARYELSTASECACSVVGQKYALSLNAANKIITGTIAEAKANNWSVDIAIVDEGGNLLSFQRVDGASIG